MEMPSKKLILGCVGAGKSTFINQMNGNNECNVSHLHFKDGTTNFSQFGDYIDTPGLDSKNKVWKTLYDKITPFGNDFQIILILDGHMARAHTFIERFDKVLTEFVSPKFCIIWTKVDVSAEKKAEWGSKYGGQLVRQFSSNTEIDFRHCPVSSLKPKHIPPPPALPTNQFKTEAKKKKANTSQQYFYLSNLTGVGKCLNRDKSKPLETFNHLDITIIQEMCEKVVGTNDPEVHHMRVLGDCTVKFIALAVITHKKWIVDSVSEFILPVIKNDNGLMSRFVDEHFVPHLKNNFFLDSNHSKADCFEAVIAYGIFGSKQQRQNLNRIVHRMMHAINAELTSLFKAFEEEQSTKEVESKSAK